MLRTEFEPTIPACERLQTLALDRAVNGVSYMYVQIKAVCTSY